MTDAAERDQGVTDDSRSGDLERVARAAGLAFGDILDDWAKKHGHTMSPESRREAIKSLMAHLEPLLRGDDDEAVRRFAIYPDDLMRRSIRADVEIATVRMLDDALDAVASRQASR